VIRVAAVGDIHLGEDSAGTLRPHLDDLADRADVLLIAGDLTQRGRPEEAKIVADELADVPVPVVTVLGNHDLHSDCGPELRAALTDAGVRVLDGEVEVISCGGERLGIAGVKGFGVGFAGGSCSDFGEPVTRQFFAHARDEACKLEELLLSLDGEVDVRVALMHYSPVEDTLVGEPPAIWAFLGSYLLGEAVDRGGADLALHGHAHRGAEKGRTPGGVAVRNVAQPVIRSAYHLYTLNSTQ
jgi:Icc-related predicted phosphoesterase